MSFRLPSGHPAERLSPKQLPAFWAESGKGTLPLDSLVCLVQPGRTLLFATVVRRDVQELASPWPIVGLAFMPGTDFSGVLSTMGSCKQLENAALVQV